MKRWFSGLIAGAMIFSAIPTVAAHEFTDIDDHWAKPYIEYATEKGLFNGTSATTFSPQSNITRGMFVTVLGRLEGIEPSEWCNETFPPLFCDVPADQYYAPYVNWAALNGIVNGVGDGRFSPNAQITREQMAKILVSYGSLPGHSIESMPITAPTEATTSEDASQEPVEPTEEVPVFDTFDVASPDVANVLPSISSALAAPLADEEPGEKETPQYADDSSISAWAVGYVYAASELGLMNGSPREDGIYFRPQDSATRAEGAAVFCRLDERLKSDDANIVLPESVSLSESELELSLGESAFLSVDLKPVEAGYTTTFYWVSSNPAVVDCYYGTLQAKAIGESVITVYTNNRLSASCKVTVPDPALAGLPSANDSYYEKCMLVFGEVVSAPNRYCYDMTREEALAMTELITVPIWAIGRDGTKYSTTTNVRIHKNLVPAIRQIFKEIFEGKEQFPFHAVSGWTWRDHGVSEHYCGCALDLNPNENPYVDPNGKILVGSHFKPGEDPYSIPVGGEVDQIFAKYGFKRGIYWNNQYKDYMHYSFFGT